jgi:hypothetical protein
LKCLNCDYFTATLFYPLYNNCFHLVFLRDGKNYIFNLHRKLFKLSYIDPNMEKKTLICFVVLLLIQFSCHSSTDLKRYGIITCDTSYAASIDTTGHKVIPITLTTKHFQIENRSNVQKIVFVCKCTFVNVGGNVSEDIEKYTVGPKETVKLKEDSTNRYNITKYEIVEAYLATN